MDEKENVFNFEIDDEQTEDLLKKAKDKSLARIVATSLGVAIGVMLLLIILKIQITPLLLEKEMIETHMYEQLYGANTYIGQWKENYDLVYSSATAPKYKIVDGIVVPMGEVSIPAKANGRIDKVVNQEGETYGVNGERIMLFYHPALEYTSYRQDLEKLEKVNKEKHVEMALSFDQGYSYEQVMSMLPKDVTLQWSWVDIYDEARLIQGNEGIEVQPWYENEVVGIKSFDAWGEKVESPVEAFLIDLEVGIRRGKGYRELFLAIEEQLKGEDGVIEPESLNIVGVVVAGTPEELLTLKESPFIKASSFGAIVEKY